MSQKSMNQNSKYERLVAKGSEAYVSELEKTEWFKGRSETPQEFLNKLKAQTAEQSFCEELIDFNFFDTDIDGNGDPKDYKQTITDILKGTVFPLDSVEADYNQEELFLSIKTTTNHTYKFSFVPFNAENLELADVIENFLNKILSKEDLAEQFFSIPGQGSLFAWTITTKKTYQAIKRRGLIPDPDYFMDYWFGSEEEEVDDEM